MTLSRVECNGGPIRSTCSNVGILNKYPIETTIRQDVVGLVEKNESDVVVLQEREYDFKKRKKIREC